MKTLPKITISKYDPIWPTNFEALKNTYQQKIGHLLLGIEHVGSTAVVGLAAKPVLDIDLIIDPKKNKFPLIIKELAKLGYRHVGDLGITGREAFKRKDDKTPHIGTNQIWQKHHLYVCEQGSIGLLNHLNLRDYLRKHPKAVQAYGELKMNLAQQFPYDMDNYVEGKTAFITNILQKVGMTKSTISLITKENKATT